MASLKESRLKIARANHHIDNLRAEIERFLAKEPYIVVEELDSDRGQYVNRVREKEPIPDELSLIAGDALHNLRASLDYVVWQLVDGKGTRGHQFPIVDDPAKLDGAIRGNLSGVAPEAVAIIRDLQPCVTHPSAPETSPLFALHKLDIDDKHKLLTAIAFDESRATHFLPVGPAPGGFFLSLEFNTRVALVDGAELSRYAIDGDPKMKVKQKLSFAVTFREPGALGSKEVIPALESLRDTVAEVVTRFEPFF
jgi:hypothetical protein